MDRLTGALLVLSGGLVGLGLFYLVGALVRPAPSLTDSLDRMSGVERHRHRSVQVSDTAARSERLGAWLYARSPIPLTDGQRRLLTLKNKSIPEFFADKAVMAILGCLVPLVLGVVVHAVAPFPFFIPAGAALVGAVVGWFIPDFQLRGAQAQTKSDAGDAMFTFFDLVVLERLANRSGTQALHSAASMSDSPLFRQIRASLERARLEQQPPYAELRRLAEQLNLPELADVADVMQLDETGAALSGTLRARVRELRDAHLTESKIAANEVSERMTIFMTLPSMIFGAMFLVPPLLHLTGIGG